MGEQKSRIFISLRCKIIERVSTYRKKNVGDRQARSADSRPPRRHHTRKLSREMERVFGHFESRRLLEQQPVRKRPLFGPKLFRLYSIAHTNTFHICRCSVQGGVVNS